MFNYITAFILFVHSASSLNPNVLNSLQVQRLPTEDNKINNKVNYQIDVNDGKVTYESDLNDHSSSYRYKTADGTIKYESTRFEDSNLVVEGGYEYIGDNGLTYSITYIADKNGYRPQVSFGSKLIVPSPPINTGYPAPSPSPQCYPGSADSRCSATEDIRPSVPGASGEVESPPTPPALARPPLLPIDPAVLCSLAGSGCK